MSNRNSLIFDMPTVLTVIGGVAITVSMFWGVKVDQAIQGERIVSIDDRTAILPEMQKQMIELSKKIDRLERNSGFVVKSGDKNENQPTL